MKTTYLVLAVIGFIVPNLMVALESYQTGNILLWLDPAATANGMFGNRISAAFILHLLLAVFVFFIWTFHESKARGFNVFGSIGCLPYCLAWRARSPCFFTNGRK